MPKKSPRNSFYFYMVHFKEEQRKKGINYKNMAEVAEAAGPSWRVSLIEFVYQVHLSFPCMSSLY